ncbi:uncharacterized protein EI90DRAFT_3015558 [Cantharellus anzutake]|uniref:uncharacterized protein n=1 Tax=Cantharellus anzutake TaxID=1750568 RepID=UPI001902FB5E|nr:uncharacterized protein EI90DRAFT_3015558 [Cantharellus anzutake]KAF8333110.1 hypothetical protein EI90DRAFT_3015558 [Cantharellus anzutake]
MDPSAVPFPSTPEKPRHSAIEATRNSLNRTSMSLSVSAKSRDPSLNWMTAQPSTTPKFSRNQLNAIPIIMPLSRTEVEERRKSIGPSSGIARSWQGSMKNGKRLSVEQLERTKSSRELTTMAPRLAVPADLKDQGRLSRSLTSVDQSSKVPVVRIVGPMPVDPAVERLREIGDLILGQSSLSLSMRSDSAGSISASTSSPSKSSSVSTLDFSLNSTRSSKTSLDTIPPRPAFHSSEVFTSGSPDGSSDNGSARSSLETPPLSPAHRMLMSTSAPSLTSTSVRTLVPAIAIDGVDVNAIAKPNAAMTNSLNVRHGTGSATSLSTLCPTAVRTTLSSSRISLPPGARPPENFRPNGRGVIVLGTIPLDSPMSGKPTKKKGWRRWFT